MSRELFSIARWIAQTVGFLVSMCVVCFLVVMVPMILLYLVWEGFKSVRDYGEAGVFVLLLITSTALIIGIPLTRAVLRLAKSKGPDAVRRTREKLEPIAKHAASVVTDAIKPVVDRVTPVIDEAVTQAAPHVRAGAKWLLVRSAIVLLIAAIGATAFYQLKKHQKEREVRLLARSLIPECSNPYYWDDYSSPYHSKFET